MKRNLLAVVTVSLFVLVVSSKAEAMLDNGGFDSLASSEHGKIYGYTQGNMPGGAWDVYDSVPGWKSGSGTAGIEIQKNLRPVKAHSGNFYVELDSHRRGGGSNTNSSMYQTVSLDTGSYNLGWYYHARSDAMNDNGIKAFLKDSSGGITDIGDVNKTNSEQTALWENIDWTFSIASAGEYELWFEAFGTDNTIGGLIDSVTLLSSSMSSSAPAPVPEPATMLLFGTGLACLAGVARRKKK